MSNKIKRICIIVPNLLPLPNVKGGAIETLMTDIINQNEEENMISLTVVSMFDEQAYNLSKKYKYTDFIYIKRNFKYYLKALYVRLSSLFGRKLNTYNEMVLDEIKDKKYDYIVVEDGAFKLFGNYLKYYKKEQMYIHFHHVGDTTPSTDNVFGHFIGVSAFVVNNFAKTTHIKDLIVLKNGVNDKKFIKDLTSKERNSIRSKLGFDESDIVVIYCGRLVPQKGVLELVNAIKNIKEENIKLMIVGSINFGVNETSEYLMNLNNEINNSNGKIVLTGYVDNKDVYKYYKSADIGIIPSTYNDAAPLVTIETMLCGIPLIVTNSGGAPEYISKDTIVIDREKNLEENIKKEIIKLSKDSKLRKKISDSGLKESKKYTTKQFYHNFINTFK